MRILVLQFVPSVRGRPVPRFEQQLGTLLALLRGRGHTLGLLGLARFDQAAIKSNLARDLPQLVYADISPVCVDLARRSLEFIHQHEFLPIVAGGMYAAVDPAACLSLPGVHAVAIGEPDASLITYFERMKDPAAGQVVSGVWLRDERGLARPDLPALVEDLDSLPFPERDVFHYAEQVRRTGELEVAIGRGCPQQCAYCVNDWLESIYENRGTWVRRRSPPNVIEEIEQLRSRYVGARTVRFRDHAFAQDPGWLSEFLDCYVRTGALPFRCHLRANSTDEPTVRKLAAAGAILADVEVISASEFLRNEVFDMDLRTPQVRDLFAWLHTYKLPGRAIVYLGAPYESEASLAQTQALLETLRPAQVDIRPYYPFPGTRAQELSRENGWLHPRGEEQFHNERPGIDLPACRPEIIASFVRRLRQQFPTHLGAPWWRRWYHAPARFWTRLNTPG